MIYATLRAAARLARLAGLRWLSRRLVDLAIEADGPRQPPTTPFKRCGCGRTYSLAGWRCLVLVGHGLGLEHRRCMCGSTIAVEERPV